jgi:hypothetical protein
MELVVAFCAVLYVCCYRSCNDMHFTQQHKRTARIHANTHTHPQTLTHIRTHTLMYTTCTMYMGGLRHIIVSMEYYISLQTRMRYDMKYC